MYWNLLAADRSPVFHVHFGGSNFGLWCCITSLALSKQRSFMETIKEHCLSTILADVRGAVY